MMANGANPNANPMCFKKIRIQGLAGGQTTMATVVDTCMGCAPDSIDVSWSVRRKVAPQGNGRVHGVVWDGPL